MTGSGLLDLFSTTILSGIEFGSLNALMVIGFAIALRFGNFPDLTLEGTINISSAVTAVAIVNGAPPAMALLLSGVCGAIAGSITALLRVFARMSKLLAGIVTMTALYAVSLRIMNGSNLPLFGNATLYTDAGNWLLRNLVSLSVIVPCVLLVGIFLHTEIGIFLRAFGENESLLLKLGRRGAIYGIITLAVSNGLIGISGSLISQYNQFADIGFGAGSLVSSLAALLLGEAVIYPSTVNRQLLAALVGSILYSTILAIALRLGLHPWDLKLAAAAFVIIVILLTKQDVMGKRENRRVGCDPL